MSTAVEAITFAACTMPGQIGWIFFGCALAAFLGTLLGPALATRVGDPSATVVGGLVAAAGFLALVVAHGSTPVVIAWLAVSMLGNGMVISVLPNIVVSRAQTDAVGIASGLYITTRTAAGAVAAAAFTAVMSGAQLDVGNGVRITAESGYRIVWAACGGLALLVSAAAVLMRDRADAAAPILAEPARVTES